MKQQRPARKKTDQKVDYNLKKISRRRLRQIKEVKKFHAIDVESDEAESGNSSSSFCASNDGSFDGSQQLDTAIGCCFQDLTKSNEQTNANNMKGKPEQYPSPSASLPLMNEAPDNADNASFHSQSVSANTSVCSDKASSVSSAPTEEDSFVCDLRQLINNYPYIPQSAVTELLKLLNKHKRNFMNEKIPNSCRTLMKTPRRGNRVITLRGANNEKSAFYYFGIKNSLQKYARLLNSSSQEIPLAAHIDGVEADKSTGLEHWPILAKILNIKANVIFPIALYTGYGKPPCLEGFLREFVDEVNLLSEEGVTLGGSNYEFKLHRMLGDAPARYFYLNLRAPNSYSSCLYCDVVGKRLHNRIHFYLTEDEMKKIQKRDVKKFNEVGYPRLQKGPTPLRDLRNFDCFKDCPFDPLHMLYLRIQGRLNQFWVKVDTNAARRAGSKKYKLSASKITAISYHLVHLKKNIPVEFQRKTESLWKFYRFKATQLRFELLYVGIIVFKKHFSKDVYENYLLLHFSIRRLSDPGTTTAQLDVVQEYLEQFIHSYANIYGVEVVNHYIHALIHLVDSVKRHGPLDGYSAALFESYLSIFAKLKHSANRPAQQVVNRILERQISSRELYFANRRLAKFSKSDEYDGPFPDEDDVERDDFRTYSRITLELYSINVLRSADNLVLLKDGTIIRVLNILARKTDAEHVLLYGYPLMNKKDFYLFPEPSSSVGIWEVIDNMGCRYFKDLYDIDDLLCKCVGFPLENDRVVAMRMLH